MTITRTPRRASRREADALRRTLEIADGRIASLTQQLAARDERIAEAEARIDELELERVTDPLTRLLNRVGLAERWATTQWRGLLLLDLDGFKQVNDTLGHEAGDVLLKRVAERLSWAFDPVARLGGDEFVVLVQLTDPGELGVWLAEQIAQVGITASVGVADGCQGLDLDSALRRADVAMYRAKQAKTQSGQVCTWREDMTMPRRAAWARRGVRR